MKNDGETYRIEAFSDAVFAIAITLLVLEIKVPSHDTVAQYGLVFSLFAIWPSFLAFITSFITILVIWVHHHWIFTVIGRCDHALVYWNGLLLLFVTFVPFPTGLLAEYLLHSEAKVAASFYTGTFLAIALAFHGLWRHASNGGRLLTIKAISSPRETATRITSHYRLGPILYFGSFVLSFISEIGGASSCMFLALFFALRGWPIESRR
jgi:uncharacterized membrane protein